jgi:hypothetical protein
MIDKSEYNPSKRLSKKPFESVSTPNARKHAKRKREIYRKNKGKEKTRR